MVEFKENKISELTKDNSNIKKEKTIKFVGSPNFNKIRNKIPNNEKINREDIRELVKSIKESKVSIFGEEINQEELNNISQQDIKITTEILVGDYDNYYLLTYLFSEVAKKLSERQQHISLDKVSYISDKAAE